MKNKFIKSAIALALATGGASYANDDASFEIKLKGRYQLVVSSPSRGSRVAAEFDNLILDSGLDKLGESSSPNAGLWCRVGTGTTTPSTGQTSLISQIAATSDSTTTPKVTTYYPGSTPYTETVTTYRFATGVATGTISEIGVGWTNTGSTLFSRALILDGGGSPTTLTILSDETLDAKYFFRIYSPTSDVTGSLSIGGTTYNYTLRAMFINNTGYWSSDYILTYGFMNNMNSVAGIFPSTSTLGSTTGSPSGGAVNATGTPTITAYVNGNFWKETEVVFGLTDNVSGGIKCMRLSCNSPGGAWFQLGFDAAVPKDSTKQFKFKFRITWARV